MEETRNEVLENNEVKEDLNVPAVTFDNVPIRIEMEKSSGSGKGILLVGAAVGAAIGGFMLWKRYKRNKKILEDFENEESEFVEDAEVVEAEKDPEPNKEQHNKK